MPQHQQSIADALQRLLDESFASRLWQRDPDLWPAPSLGGDPADQTLGWLDLPMRLPMLAEQFEGLSGQLTADGFTDVVVLGMGGSSMTPLTLSSLFADQSGGSSTLRLHALDTVNPATVSEISERLDLSKTLFFVSSKSGTTVEPLSLESYFRSAMSDDSDLSANRRNFIALTDPGTPLSDRARAGEFGTWVSTPENVGGRFSALSAFGMMPAAAIGLNIREFAESAGRMAQKCQTDSESNPGLELGAFMAANALSGRDKVTLLTAPEFSAFGMWVDQLLAESTGKNGKGLVPITGEPMLAPDQYGNDRQFVVFETRNATSQFERISGELEAVGHPVLTISMPTSNRYDIAGEFFRWQFATAIAAALMDIYPFDQPDVETAKVKSRELLSHSAVDIDTVEMKHALGTVKAAQSPGYVAIVAFLPESPELTAAFMLLRKNISINTGMATTFGYGPRYLHSTGQLYKGGPQNATVLGFVSGKEDDLAVPGAGFTFGQLTEAQTGGDFIVMAEGGQTVLPIRLGNNPAGEIDTAAKELIN
jgi:transaldolase/glucose-6-phosphate isomerase